MEYYLLNSIVYWNFLRVLVIITSIGAKSSFSRPVVVKTVDQLELFIHLQLRS